MNVFGAYLPWSLAWGSEKNSSGKYYNPQDRSIPGVPKPWSGLSPRGDLLWPTMVVKRGHGRACKAPTKPVISPPCEDAQVANSKLAGQKWEAPLAVLFALAPIWLSPGWHWVGNSPRAAFIWVEEGLQRSQTASSQREEGWRPR